MDGTLSERRLERLRGLGLVLRRDRTASPRGACLRACPGDLASLIANRTTSCWIRRVSEARWTFRSPRSINAMTPYSTVGDRGSPPFTAPEPDDGGVQRGPRLLELRGGLDPLPHRATTSRTKTTSVEVLRTPTFRKDLHASSTSASSRTPVATPGPRRPPARGDRPRSGRSRPVPDPSAADPRRTYGSLSEKRSSRASGFGLLATFSGSFRLTSRTPSLCGPSSARARRRRPEQLPAHRSEFSYPREG